MTDHDSKTPPLNLSAAAPRRDSPLRFNPPRRAKARVQANWTSDESMKQKAPAHAINWQAVFRPPGNGGGDGNKRVMGLHPDAPLSGRTLRELREPGLE